MKLPKRFHRIVVGIVVTVAALLSANAMASMPTTLVSTQTQAQPSQTPKADECAWPTAPIKRPAGAILQGDLAISLKSMCTPTKGTIFHELRFSGPNADKLIVGKNGWIPYGVLTTNVPIVAGLPTTIAVRAIFADGALKYGQFDLDVTTSKSHSK